MAREQAFDQDEANEAEVEKTAPKPPVPVVPEGVERSDPDASPEVDPSPPQLPEPGIGVEIPTDAQGAGEGLVGVFPSMIDEVKFGSDNVMWEIEEHPSRGISRIVVHASPVQDGTLTARVTLHE
jgi:hypothetical protein